MTRKTMVILAMAALLTPVASCDDAVGPAAEPDWVIFLSDRDATSRYQRIIYRVTVDGAEVEPLVAEPAQYSQLALSPDGARVAFSAALARGCQNIWSMNVDGSDLRQLSGVGVQSRCNLWPRWSPDGTRIAWMSTDQPELSWEVHVMNADGTGRVNMTNHPATDLVEGWTPDGRLVISSDRDGSSRPYVLRADGTAFDPLFEDPSLRSPRWSPDGSRVAAVRPTDEGSRVLILTGAEEVVVDEDPSEYDNLRTDVDPWSPDGTRLAFVGGPAGGERNIRIVNADGTGLRQVTTGGTHTFRSWSPDGTRILFSSSRDGHPDILVANEDGSGAINITNSKASDGDGIWVPRRR